MAMAPVIDKGVTGFTVLVFQLHDGVKRVAGGFAPDSGPDRIPELTQSNCQGEYFRDTLYRKKLLAVSGTEDSAVCHRHRNGKLIGVDTGQLRNVIRNSASVITGTNCGDNLI